MQENVLSKGGIDTTLSGDSVTSCREKLRDASCIEASLCETEGGTQTGTTGTDDYRIIFVILEKSEA